MTTIKLDKFKLVKETVDVELPYYCKGVAHAYCIYAEDRAVKVFKAFDDESSIEHTKRFESALDESKYPQCTREEFIAEYNIVKDIINRLEANKI